jgi:hypothetical protein
MAARARVSGWLVGQPMRQMPRRQWRPQGLQLEALQLGRRLAMATLTWLL